MSLILSIFCPLCQQPYDNDNKGPRQGSCGHNACNPCISSRQSPKCPICELGDSFKTVIYNYELKKVLEQFRDNATQELVERSMANPVELERRNCQCRNPGRILRMCITCAETSNLLTRLPNGNFKLLEKSKTLQLAKSVIFCTDCSIDHPNHADHSFSPLSKIDVIKMDLKLWSYIIYVIFLEEKLTNADKAPAPSDDIEVTKRVILNFKRELINFEMRPKDKETLNQWIDRITLKELDQIDYTCIPELAEAKKKSVELAKKFIEQVRKLEERLLWFIKAEVNIYTNAVEAFRELHHEPEWEELEKEIKHIANKFNCLQIAELSEDEAEQLDDTTDIKLAIAKSKLEFPEPNDRLFYNFKALCNIFKENEEMIQMANEKCIKEVMSFGELLENRLPRLRRFNEGQSTEDELSKKLIIFEIVEGSLELDKLALELQTLHYESLEAHLIWARYFPNPRDGSLEFAYFQFLNEKFLSFDVSLTKQLFSLSLN